jgi:transposase InsO family protein
MVRRRHAAVVATVCSGRTSTFAGALDTWAYANGVVLRFIRPGRPIENAYVESFNGQFRDECLNEHWFVSVAEAKTDRGVARGLQHGAAPSLARPANAGGLRRSRLRGPQARVWGLLGGCSGLAGRAQKFERPPVS